jgi:DNA-binding NarL/FixJ family response regulator
MSIKILLADDHEIFREGIHALLDKEPDIEVVGGANNGKETVRLAQDLTPDVVVMDITMPDLNGIEATRQIKKKIPNAKVLCLSMHSDRKFVLEMFRAGASAYLLKNCAFKELTRAIHAVVSNQFYVSPEITHIIIDESLANQATVTSSIRSILTTRELQVLQLIAEGHNIKEIALFLNKSAKTIETHRRRIMTKLNIHSVAGIIKYAISEGLTSLDT